MRSITCLLLVCLAVFGAAESGLKLTITPKAIAAFKDQFLPQVVAQLQNLQIPPITSGGLTVSNFTLKQLYLPSENLGVKFDTNLVSLTSNSFGIQAHFHIDYTLWGLIPISTTIECANNKSFSNFAISIGDDHLLNIQEFKVQILNLDIQFPESYLGPVYHGLIYVLTWPIEYIVSQIINSQVKSALQTTLDEAIARVPGFIVLPNTTIGLDYQITSKPKISTDYLTVYINGTFYDGSSKFAVPPVVDPRDYPEFDNISNQHVQTFVSEFVFNTALYQVFQKGMMKVNVTNDMLPPEAGIKFSINWLKQFIPNISNYFNASNNVTMELNVASNPITNITKQDMKVNADTQISFYVADGANVTQIVKIQSNLELHANITLTNWTLKPYIISAAFGNFSVLQSNVGEVSGDKFQQGFNILFLFAIGGFNAQFQPIALPKVPGVNLENSVVSFEEGHIRIQASPSYAQVPSLALRTKSSLRTEKF